MPLQIIRQDITKIKCDAIVNPTDRWLSGGGGVDALIREAAEEQMDARCAEIGSLSVGEAVLTPAYAMENCKFVIHVAGPVWRGGLGGERVLLRSCYLEALELAWDNKCRSVAFPLIASGTYGYPKDKVLKIATATISDFLMKHEMNVYLVVYDVDSYEISQSLKSELDSYIERVYNQEDEDEGWLDPKGADCSIAFSKCCSMESSSLDDYFDNLDKGFSDTLFDYIDKKGMTDVEAYKRSNVSRKVFSKIKCTKNYTPSKITAVSFAIGLHLSLEETEHLLSTAGMCLSRSSKFDVIIEYFVKTGKYKDIHEVNEVLYQYDQVLLGC
ncbi:MAG: macro domain-containing protein [Clostridia bacterium]|nr:macro domain-containing protein [Clostridia bacterium]